MKDTFDYKNARDLNLLLIDANLDPSHIHCMVCRKRHFPDEETFITFYGNVTIGLKGGIIGNSFRSDGTLGRLSFICRSEKCLNELYERVKP